MKTYFKTNLLIIFLFVLVTIGNCVPTSVLVNAKNAAVLNNSKVKRSPSTASASSSGPSSSTSSLSPSSSTQFNAQQQQQQQQQIMKSVPKKRGASSPLQLYGDVYNSMPAAGPLPNGVWGDEVVDPHVMYSELQELDDYPRGYYHPKSYENLQSILNTDVFPGQIQYQYPGRYYEERKKRSNKNLYDLRYKRESNKLSPTDMLALIALLEAEQRTKFDEEQPNKSYFSPYNNLPLENENDAWLDSPNDFYGMPYNFDEIPKYELMKDQRNNPNHYPSKRYMVAKKKRSLSYPSFNDPAPLPSTLYNRLALQQDALGTGGTKKYQNFY